MCYVCLDYQVVGGAVWVRGEDGGVWSTADNRRVSQKHKHGTDAANRHIYTEN